MRTFLIAGLAATLAATALAEPVTYKIDPKHTYPSFEADHFGGMSIWRGKFTKTSGSITLDRAAKSGSVDVTIDTSSVSVGIEDLEKHLRSPDFFDVAKYPTATYQGKFTNFVDGKPTEVQGSLTMHGVTRPVVLTIRSLKCMPHPLKNKKEFCGADAAAMIDRSEFGMVWGKNFGFGMDTKLAIQVETDVAK